MRIAKLRFQIVLGQRGPDPRNEIAAIGLVVGMLELASTAFRKVPARRVLVMRAGCECPIVEQRISRNSKRHVAPG